MSGVSWERARPLLHAAMELPEAERRTLLETACADDPALLAYVLGVLDHAADDGAGDVADHVALFDVPPPMPTTIGPYRILAYIGEGGMGVVYRGTREPFEDGRFAIKVLPGAALSPALRKQFAAEEQILMKLTHPGIAQLDGLGVLPDGTPYFAMEYVKGESLTAYCDARACTIDERLRLVSAVCDPVQYAHGRLVIHRDLKPHNILVPDPDDPGARAPVKLLDFGIAIPIEQAGAERPATRPALRMMTRPYAAPEQVRGEQADVQTDVFALGVILYELLAGERPFDRPGMTPAQIEARITGEGPERPSAAARRAPAGSPAAARAASLGAGAWADLDTLCLTALEKDLGRRYATVQSFAQDIDRYLRHEPLAARPATFRYRAGKFARRNRRPLAAAAAVLLLVAGIVSFYTARLAAARDAALAQATRVERVQHFTENLFNGGDNAAGPADSVHISTLLDRGLQNAHALDADPAVQADLLLTLGNIYKRLGRLVRADSILHVVLARRRALVGPEHRDIAEVLVALGEVCEEQGRAAEAERFARAGLAMARRTYPADDPAVPRAMTALARVLVQAHHNLPESITLGREAVRALSASGKAPRDLGISLQILGIAELHAGNLAAADSAQRAGLVVDRRLYPGGHPQVASDLADLGAVAFQRGDFAGAERAYREAVQMTEVWYGPNHMQTGAANSMLAGTLLKLNRADEAVPLLERALTIEERDRDPAHIAVVSTLNTLGAVATARGRLDDAQHYFDRVIAIMRAVGDSNHHFVGAALTNEGKVWLLRGDPTRAERVLREALAVMARNSESDSVALGVAHLRLGRALARQARWPDAERELLAGYALIDPRVPTSEWATQAREDLATVYDATGRHDDARKYRAVARDSVRS